MAIAPYVRTVASKHSEFVQFNRTAVVVVVPPKDCIRSHGVRLQAKPPEGGTQLRHVDVTRLVQVVLHKGLQCADQVGELWSARQDGGTPG